MKWNTLLFAFVALTASVNATVVDTPIVIRFSHVVSFDTPKGKAAERFKELAEKATNGRVRVEVYPSSQLYNDNDELEALQLGAVQMLAPSLAKFGPLGVREFEVFDLPFIFSTKETLYRITHGPIGRDLLHKLESKGITGLAYWDNGFKVMSSNRPLLMPADFKGLRMRIQPSKVLDAQMRALGANPLVLRFSEVYRALENSVVDGTENPPSNFYTQHMQEYQSHLTVSNHGYLGYAVVVNKKFWDGLPQGIRRSLEGAMKEATSYANEIAERENEAAIDAIRKSGKTTIHLLTAQQKDEWRKALVPIQKEMEVRIGRDFIAAVTAATKREAEVAGK
jgi:C4-dicarboxylate-binding protein DctP